MDASKITELRQKQNTVYIKRANTVDSSTMTWMNQIQSSKYIKGVATCTGLQNTNVPTEAVCANGDGSCSYGGRGKQTTLATGSTRQYRSVLSGAAGSASEVYSSDKILLQKAGRQYCAERITEQDAYTVLPTCYNVNTNGPTSDNPTPSINNQVNPYLPAFDTYYQFKNKSGSTIDKNAKHFVKSCNGCVIEPVVTRYGWPLFMVGMDSSSYSISNSITYTSDSVIITGTFMGTIDVYDGNITPTITGSPLTRLVSTSPTIPDAFIMKYDVSGKLQWYTTIATITGTQTTGYSVITDSTGIYVSGYMDGTVQFYNGTNRDIYFARGSPVASLTTSSAALFVVKYTMLGYAQWVTQIDNIVQLAAIGPEIQATLMNGICTDGQNVYVCNDFATSAVAYSANGLNAPSSALSFSTSNGSTQACLVQYNASTGVVNWGTQMTSQLMTDLGMSNAMGMVCDTNKVYFSGYFNTAMAYYQPATPANPTFGAPINTVTNGMNNSMFIMSYSKSGVFQWINQGNIASTLFVSNGVQLALDASGVYVLTPFPEAISLLNNPYTGTYGSFVQLINTGGSNTYNIGIIKYSLAGSIVWLNKIMNVDNGRNNVSTNGFSISSDGSALYVTGGFGVNTIGLYNSSNTDPTPQIATLATAGGTNMNTFLIKYNLLGALQWSTLIGKAGSFAYGYGVSSNTNIIYVTGMANGSIDLYNSRGTSQPTTIGASIVRAPGSYFYAYVAKYDSNGQVAIGY
jgi:hypothetical protein